jgi:AcrR family transcriptional regulator
MPRFSETEKERLYSKLYSEGERLFAEYGIKKVTIDDLVAAVGIAKASFYTFYESKEYLYLDIVQKLQQTIFADLEVLLASNSRLPNKERVLQVFGAMSQLMLQYPILIKMDTATAEWIARKVSSERLAIYHNQNFDAVQTLYNHGIRFTCDIQTASCAFRQIHYSWLRLQGQGEEIQAAVTNILLQGVIDQVVVP